MAGTARRLQKEEPFTNYVKEIKKKLSFEESREHAYRPALQCYVEALRKNITAINDAARIHCGAPDFIVYDNKTPIGYIEAKDIGESLTKHEKSKQVQGYHSLGNLILTDYIEFRLYRNGREINRVKIGKVRSGKIQIEEGAEESLLNLFEAFLNSETFTVSSAVELSERLASTTKGMRDLIIKAFEIEEDSKWLKRWLNAFREVLLENLTINDFADMFAQTLSYGFFAARVHHRSNVEFSRFSAAKILPNTNPFLRRLFAQFAGVDMPETISWAVDEIVEVLKRSDMKKILGDFKNNKGREDAVVHFYETFLSKYDPSLKQKRGVYYTPAPVVKYIVNSVDELLKSDFKKKSGLANDDTLILDPAVGTASFLFEVLDRIHSKFKKKKGLWDNYVETNLLKRVYGFEILMAPYAVSHLKLGMQLQETGYKFQKKERLGIYLTNTLEEAAKKSDELLFDFISEEANAASSIKREAPIMVVLGNPPYSVASQNKGDWINDLIKDYKKGLNERKTNLDDDFIKFLRFSQWRIEKTGHGMVAMITNNVFLDGLTHRKMRQTLSEVFDSIYILNLHGHVQKQEKTPDGKRDDNVFDIQQGVSINLFIKSKEKKEFKIKYADLWGCRDDKYDFLNANSVKSTKWIELNPSEPHFFFTPKEFENEDEYNYFFPMREIFKVSQNSIKTDKDKLFVDFKKDNLRKKIKEYLQSELSEDFIEEYSLSATSSYDPVEAKRGVKFLSKDIRRCLYRPFDVRWMYYNRDVISRPAWKVMEHMTGTDNMSILTTRQVTGSYFNHVLATPHISEIKAASHDRCCEVFPLYLVPSEIEKASDKHLRSLNLKEEFLKIFPWKVCVNKSSANSVSASQLFFYILAFLNSDSYQKRYFQNLKIDYPRIPITSDKTFFNRMSKLGEKIYHCQLMEESSGSEDFSFPEKGDLIVGKFKYESSQKRLYINKDQYFENVEATCWEYTSSGYQVVQKWLKDRKGCQLSAHDCETLKTIMASINETLKVKSDIDSAICDFGGWQAITSQGVKYKEEISAEEVLSEVKTALKKARKKKRTKRA